MSGAQTARSSVIARLGVFRWCSCVRNMAGIIFFGLRGSIAVNAGRVAGSLQRASPSPSLCVNRGNAITGSVRLWQDESIETELSIFWDLTEEEALIVISDKRAGKGRIAEYRLRFRVEATFQDGKSR